MSDMMYGLSQLLKRNRGLIREHATFFHVLKTYYNDYWQTKECAGNSRKMPFVVCVCVHPAEHTIRWINAQTQQYYTCWLLRYVTYKPGEPKKPNPGALRPTRPQKKKIIYNINNFWNFIPAILFRRIKMQYIRCSCPGGNRGTHPCCHLYIYGIIYITEKPRDHFHKYRLL